MTVNHKLWGTICAICFDVLTEETCVVDSDGTKWDICPGQCAIDAGIEEYVAPE
jgi:hypothetical protein